MSSHGTDTHLPDILSPVDARILASLVEKEATTPEAYPLTANAVQLACNQKNNRDPVMALEAGEVGHALRDLESRGLVRSVHGARAQRYEHRMAEAWSLTRQQQALLATLLLRGARTASALLASSERLAILHDAEETRQLLERLVQRGLVVNLGRGAGQREDRWMHLLCGPVSAADLPPPKAVAARDDGTGVAARLQALEDEVAALRARLERLENAG